MLRPSSFASVALLALGLANVALAQEFQISVGGDDCGMLPGPSSCLGGNFKDTGTTAGANNTVGQVNAGCFQQTAVSGADVIYAFPSFAISTPTFEIHVTPAPTYDVAIYLIGPGAAACPAGPNAVVGNCVTGADAGGPGVTETIPHAALVGLTPGDYFLFIDSSAIGPGSSGSYALTIGPGVCPVELMEFSIE